MQSIKEHNLKANHNLWWCGSSILRSACNLSKNTIWKQITTKTWRYNDIACLHAIYQRTQFESKSQLSNVRINVGAICMQSIKEHNLKANHNIFPSPYIFRILHAIYQRTQFESKSQRVVCNTNELNFCMQSIKEHNLKANHNPSNFPFSFILSACNLSKNTIWKQITTDQHIKVQVYCLHAIYQRTQFESKSQRLSQTSPVRNVCMQSIKEHNLKANHNEVCFPIKRYVSACNLSKNTIWKQITTIFI